eukprot:CAMPEP_0117540554 /NCGR_PEP_ID=MMETSP0784-20121206/43560_1 /TAXON_ID=39447 /ORGANISM="" /LENGTH=123 /DNA_ID=CAMNT_0005337215 /DNA_START=74 /DNA_END=445 /DNA_ORIENTATION=-
MAPVAPWTGKTRSYQRLLDLRASLICEKQHAIPVACATSSAGDAWRLLAHALCHVCLLVVLTFFLMGGSIFTGANAGFGGSFGAFSGEATCVIFGDPVTVSFGDFCEDAGVDAASSPFPAEHD